jgi:hypothetical protein
VESVGFTQISGLRRNYAILFILVAKGLPGIHHNANLSLIATQKSALYEPSDG